MLTEAIVNDFPFEVLGAANTLSTSDHSWMRSASFKKKLLFFLRFSDCHSLSKHLFSSLKVNLQTFTKLKSSHLVLEEGLNVSFSFSAAASRQTWKDCQDKYHLLFCTVRFSKICFYFSCNFGGSETLQIIQSSWLESQTEKTSFVRWFFSRSSASSILIFRVVGYRWDTIWSTGRWFEGTRRDVLCYASHCLRELKQPRCWWRRQKVCLYYDIR